MNQQTGNGMPPLPSLNVYTCQVCGLDTVTRHVDEGVTPFMISCKATPGCRGMMVSHFYHVPQNIAHLATHEWYYPDYLEELDAPTRDHVERGGLLLRPIEGVKSIPEMLKTEFEMEGPMSNAGMQLAQEMAERALRSEKELAQHLLREPSFQEGQYVAVNGKTFKVSRATEKILLLRPVDGKVKVEKK